MNVYCASPKVFEEPNATRSDTQNLLDSLHKVIHGVPKLVMARSYNSSKMALLCGHSCFTRMLANVIERGTYRERTHL